MQPLKSRVSSSPRSYFSLSLQFEPVAASVFERFKGHYEHVFQAGEPAWSFLDLWLRASGPSLNTCNRIPAELD